MRPFFQQPRNIIFQNPRLLSLGWVLGYCFLYPLVGIAQVQPVPPEAVTDSPLSPDNPVNHPPDSTQYHSYNNGHIELNLWQLESQRFIRSPVVVSPDKKAMAYSEVIFMPDSRQTFSKLYCVTMDKVPGEQNSRYSPSTSLQQRQTVASMGSEKTVPFEFRTLTVVDWSASGQRLLFKHKSGVLHIGLKTTDIMVFDRERGTVSIYPEVQRAIQHHWQGENTLPNLETVAWDIEPLGWEPGSNSLVLLKSWAYTKQKKFFLGLWRYDIDAHRSELVSLDNSTIPIAANGFSVTVPEPPSEEAPKKWWHRRPRSNVSSSPP